MNIKTLIFDWSGTISDDRKPVYESNMRLLKSYGKETFDCDEWLRRSKLTFSDFLNDNGIEGDHKILYAGYENSLHALREEGLKPIIHVDIIETLEKLKDKVNTMMIISSHPLGALEREMSEYGIENYFKTVLGSTKNKAKAIKEYYETKNILSSEVVYIGDTIFDIKAAKEANVISVALSTGYHSKEKLAEEKPDYLFNSFSEILKII